MEVGKNNQILFKNPFPEFTGFKKYSRKGASFQKILSFSFFPLFQGQVTTRYHHQAVDNHTQHASSASGNTLCGENHFFGGSWGMEGGKGELNIAEKCFTFRK